MRIQIKAFAGIDYVDFVVSPIALLVGHNHQGKTSICQAVAAALVNQPVARHIRYRKDMPVLVNERREKEGAFVNIQADDGESACKLTWPDGDYTSVGSAFPRSSKLAVGLESPLTAKPEERAAFLIEALQAQTTIDDLRTALKPIITSEAAREKFLTERLWPKIQEHGWDAAHARADEQRLQQEQGWWRIAGERYGARKAETWRPDPWWPDLEAPDVTIMSLTAERDRLRAEVEASVETKARTTADKIRLVAEADKLPEAERALEAARTAEDNARAALRSAQEARRACLEVPRDQPSWHKCPHCAEPVVIRDGKLFAPSQAALMPEQIQERVAAIQRADSAVASADLQLQQAQRMLLQWEQAVQAAEQAKDSLAESFEAEGHAPASDLDVEKRQALALAEQKIIQFKRFEEAKSLHSQAKMGAAIAAELAPDGVRMRVLGHKIEAFNKELAQLCRAIDHYPLWISDKMDVMVGGREYAALSKSEQFVAQIAFRLAVSMRDVARGMPVDCVIVDEADILDPPSRGKLIRMLLASKLRAVVAMTVGKPGDVPDLSRGPGMGATLWVENGMVKPVADVLKQAAA